MQFSRTPLPSFSLQVSVRPEVHWESVSVQLPADMCVGYVICVFLCHATAGWYILVISSVYSSFLLLHCSFASMKNPPRFRFGAKPRVMKLMFVTYLKLLAETCWNALRRQPGKQDGLDQSSWNLCFCFSYHWLPWHFLSDSLMFTTN